MKNIKKFFTNRNIEQNPSLSDYIKDTIEQTALGIALGLNNAAEKVREQVENYAIAPFSVYGKKQDLVEYMEFEILTSIERKKKSKKKERLRLNG